MEIHDVRLPTLMRFLEAVANHGGESVQRIADFAGSTPRTAKRAIPTLASLGLILLGDDGRISSAVAIPRGAGERAFREVFRSALLRFRPFELLCEGVSYGESEKDAVRKAAVVAGLKRTDHVIFDRLISWAAELGILERVAGGLRLAAEFAIAGEEDSLHIEPESLESPIRARLYITGRLGRTVVDRLDPRDIDLLQVALLQARSDPRGSLGNSGQALENILRELAAEIGLATEAEKCNGAAQLAALLKGSDVILTNHVHWVAAVAALRNAVGHDKDKKTREPWVVDQHSAVWGFSAAVSIVRSIHSYAFTKTQVI